MFAQVVSVNGGSISGTITDSTGAIVPNAPVQIKGLDTGITKSVTTDSAGAYSVGPLNPGNYSITVSAAGFQKLVVTTVVRVGTVTSGSYKLSVGSSSETVEVNAGSIQLNTEQPGVSDVLTSQQIQTLPINGRNFLDVAQIEPGVVLQAGGSFDPTKAGYSALSIGGVSGRTTRILLDGQDITDETVGTTIFNVSEGAIGEFQLNRSTQDVSGDVTSTGQVLVTTNTGTNKVHGELFYNFQDGRAGFASELGAVPPFQRNQFGGSIGGPIIRDKLFFFANSERIKQDANQGAGVDTDIFPQYAGLTIPFSYRETYSTGRLDWNGLFNGHYFARVNYNVNAVAGNFGEQFETYANRDNTPGIAGGADYQFGHWTHSIRGSYEKFHNLISDTSSTSGVDIFPGIALQNVSGTSPLLATGPNVDAPQGTYQSDKQIRYDGSWLKGPSNLRFGFSLNHILGGGFANFFGLGPRVRENSATLLDNCDNVAGAAPCPSDPLKGYHASSVRIGNNLGFFTEKPGFGLIGGGVHDWRVAAYVADSWKATPNMTISAGVRWSVDTDRANQDVAQIPCSALSATITADTADLPCSGSDSLLGQFGPQFAGRVRQPYGDFAPQIGLAYSLPDQKTVLRAGFGIFFEGDVFNNTTNARNALLPAGPFFAEAIPGGGNVCASGKINNPDGSISTTATVNGTTMSILDACNAPLDVAAPFLLAASQAFQAASAANPVSPNPSYIGNNINGTGTYGAPYKAPYSEQWNFGIQRELFKGGVLSVDYVHGSTLKIAQELDVNHVGAARFLNTTAAANAIAATLAQCHAASVTDAITACTSIGADGTITTTPATINDFAGNGLDSGNQYLSGAAASSQKLTVATGAAFPGANPKLGSGAFLLPVGRSGYDALQVVFREQKAHPVPGIERSNLQISYNLSRAVSSANSGFGGDQFFSNTSWDEDNPTQYIGRSGLDRKHQVSFGGSALLKYGPEIGLIGHFYSALPVNLTLDNTANANGNIFQSDLTGDGTTGDLAPGTLPGDYMHRVKPGNLASYITNFNQQYAGQLTPAGKALVAAGLMTQQQLTALNAVIQPLTPLPQSVGPANPMYKQIDATFGYPIRLGRYVHTMGDSVMLEPRVAFYNVANFANFGNDGGNPGVSPYSGNLGSPGAGSVNGPNTFGDSQRVTRQSGTFDQGAPRTIEYQLKLDF